MYKYHKLNWNTCSIHSLKWNRQPVSQDSQPAEYISKNSTTAMNHNISGMMVYVQKHTWAELSINIRRRAFSALYFSFKTENNKTTQRAYESCYGSIGRVSSLNIRIRNVSAYTKNFNFIFHFDFFWFFAFLWKNF